jgi:hypothetical protein
MPGQAVSDGTVNTTPTYVLVATVNLPTPPNYDPTTNPRIQLASITLPTITGTGAMHIFSVAAS